MLMTKDQSRIMFCLKDIDRIGICPRCHLWKWTSHVDKNKEQLGYCGLFHDEVPEFDYDGNFYG